jgi:hypothetical protein
MGLLGVVVQTLRRPVQGLATNDPTNRPAVRRVQVRRDALRLRSATSSSLRRNLRAACLSRCSLSIESMSWPSRSTAPIQVAPATGDLHVRLVEVPGRPRPAATLRAQPLREQRREPRLPRPNRLMRDLESAPEQQLGDIAEACVAGAGWSRSSHRADRS